MSGTRTSKVERMPEVAARPLPPIGDRDHVNGERLEGHWRQLAQIIPAKIAEPGR